MKNTQPVSARREQLVVQKIGDETLVYDLITNKAVCLNSTSALIWNLCDGKRSVTEIADEFTLRANIRISRDLVLLALSQLSGENLLEDKGPEAENHSATSRRELIRKAGFGTLAALPMIYSLVAPKAALAQSGALAIGAACAVPGACMSGNCLNSTCCSATSTNSNGAGEFIGCNQSPAACSAAATTFCCSGTAANTTGFSFCTAAETECTCN
ncbi:MAG: PqqD family protein [Pyrinomonadaceae bacterium]